MACARRVARIRLAALNQQLGSWPYGCSKTHPGSSN
jgi:hypothetical protein